MIVNVTDARLLPWNKDCFSTAIAGTTNDPLLQSWKQFKMFLLSQNNAIFCIMTF